MKRILVFYGAMEQKSPQTSIGWIFPFRVEGEELPNHEMLTMVTIADLVQIGFLPRPASESPTSDQLAKVRKVLFEAGVNYIRATADINLNQNKPVMIKETMIVQVDPSSARDPTNQQVKVEIDLEEF
jgi:hypothetical protein